jgi:hypothetical protein
MTERTPTLVRRAGKLALPPGWRLDGSSLARLERLLPTLPDHVLGVVAPRRTLVPGATFRTQAERASLAPRDAIVEVPAGPVTGAVLVRPRVDVRVSPGQVEVDGGWLVVDEGARAHDPDATPPELHPASPFARSPFPWRPRVLLLGLRVALDEDAARLADRLIDEGVDAHVAAPRLAQSPRLTRPCAADPSTVAALRPDVVICLDTEALTTVDAWCAGDRHTVVIERRSEQQAPIELVAWTVGVAQGRVRARISPTVDGAALARLAARLSAGPHPAAPRPPVESAEPVTLRRPTAAGGRRPSTLHRVAVVHGALDHAASARSAALVRHLRGRGEIVSEATRTVSDASATDADLLWLHAVALTDDVRALLTARRAVGRRTVVDVSPRDLALTAAAWWELTDEGRALVELAGGATTPSRLVRNGLVAAGLAAHRWPTPRSAFDRPQPRGDLSRDPAPRIGWDLGDGPQHPGVDDAVLDVLAQLLAERPDIELELVGDATLLGDRVPELPRVRSASLPSTATRADWLLQIWTPPLAYTEATDAIAPLVQASRVAVPTVMAADHAVAAELAEPDTTVADPTDREAWWKVINRLLAEPEERRAAGRRAAARVGAASDRAAESASFDELAEWMWRMGPR